MLAELQKKVEAYSNKYARFCALERAICYPSFVDKKSLVPLTIELNDLDRFFGFSRLSQFRMPESTSAFRARQKRKDGKQNEE